MSLTERSPCGEGKGPEGEAPVRAALWKTDSMFGRLTRFLRLRYSGSAGWSNETPAAITQEGSTPQSQENQPTS